MLTEARIICTALAAALTVPFPSATAATAGPRDAFARPVQKAEAPEVQDRRTHCRGAEVREETRRDAKKCDRHHQDSEDSEKGRDDD